jgi:hypothetical protein
MMPKKRRTPVPRHSSATVNQQSTHTIFIYYKPMVWFVRNRVNEPTKGCLHHASPKLFELGNLGAVCRSLWTSKSKNIYRYVGGGQRT